MFHNPTSYKYCLRYIVECIHTYPTNLGLNSSQYFILGFNLLFYYQIYPFKLKMITVFFRYY